MTKLQNDLNKDAHKYPYAPKDLHIYFSRESIYKDSPNSSVFSFRYNGTCSFITDWELPKLENHESDRSSC